MNKGKITMGKSKSFHIDDIILYQADFLKLELETAGADLIATSPPYNVGIEYGVYNDSKTYKEYLEFSKAWLAKCFEVLKNGGRICINVPIDTHSAALRASNHSIAADLTILAKRAGFKYKGTIIWQQPTKCDDYSMAFSKNIEVILIMYKDEWKPVKAEFRDWVNEIWTFAGESKKRVGHPAPFPVEIPRRLIKMFTEVGETVLDPFLGSGTTMVASYICRRNGIGVELNKDYFELAKRRLENKRW